MMSSEQSALYRRLEDFALDDPNHEFGFTRHLMKSHGWTVDYAQRAIKEYKKFAFLTVAVDHQVVPSDAVDQVWHAHILLTNSYWEEFCLLVLQKKLHHHPARGGKEERAEFHKLYHQTIKSYGQFFGKPSVEIWSPPSVRFGSELKQQRVNLSEYWLFPKRFPMSLQQSFLSMRLLRSATIAIIAGLITVGCTSSQIGGSFLLLILIGFIGVVMLFRYLLRLPKDHSPAPALDTYEIAYLAGGKLRAAELAIVSLVYQGYLATNVRHKTFSIVKPLPDSASLIEKQVLKTVGRSPKFRELRYLVAQDTMFLSHVLRQHKLLVQGVSATLTNNTMTSGGILVLVIGQIVRMVMAIGETSYLNIIVVVVGVFCFLFGICLYVPSQRTYWGDRVLAECTKEHDVHNLYQSFSISGYKVLSGGALDDLKQVFKATEVEDSSSGGCGC